MKINNTEALKISKNSLNSLKRVFNGNRLWVPLLNLLLCFG